MAPARVSVLERAESMRAAGGGLSSTFRIPARLRAISCGDHGKDAWRVRSILGGIMDHCIG